MLRDTSSTTMMSADTLRVDSTSVPPDCCGRIRPTVPSSNVARISPSFTTRRASVCRWARRTCIVCEMNWARLSRARQPSAASSSPTASGQPKYSRYWRERSSVILVRSSRSISR